MAESSSGGAKVESDPLSDSRSGAQAYARLLAGAGGTRQQVLERADGPESVHVEIYASPPYALSVPPLPVSRLAINLTPARVSGGVEGERPRQFDARRHSLFLTPAGHPVRWQKESASRHMSIYFDRNLFSNGAGDGLPPSQMPTLFNANVPGIGPLVEQLVEELQRPSTLSADAADSCGRLLLIRLARHLQCASKASHSLAPCVMARLRDYIVEHLSERILVADLAREAGLSSNHFAIAFTEQTGQSPHRFVLSLRVARAAELLGRSTLSLAEIAHDCGFASQQHLSNAVRRFLGTTPSRYRALHRL